MADPRFQVHCSGAITSALYQLVEEAHPRRREQIAAALEQIVERLGEDPCELGEPLYELPSMHLQVRTVIIRPLVVDFAVSLQAPLVFIKGVKALEESK